jgi:hypothetical protein
LARKEGLKHGTLDRKQLGDGFRGEGLGCGGGEAGDEGKGQKARGISIVREETCVFQPRMNAGHVGAAERGWLVAE